MGSKDLYSVLGVARTASQDDIRTAYRKLARELHPDKNPGDAAAEARFKEVSAAYGVLSDASKRKLYDEFGDAALQAGFDEAKARQFRQFGGGGNFDFGDFSENFSRGGGIEEILQGLFGGGGGFGGGGFPGGFGGGGGFRTRAPRKGADVTADMTIPFALSVQGGSTSVQVDGKSLDVKIPAGIKDGQSLRLAGLGAPGAQGAPAGDLKLKIQVAEHPHYTRKGDDLEVEVPVGIHEAALGGEISFPGPSGEVTLKIPPGTQSGQRLRLRGLGVRGGNLYARLRVVLPPDSDAVREAAQAFAPLYDDPRREVRFE